jgi:tetratricopeptide (TPR) repeat protein
MHLMGVDYYRCGRDQKAIEWLREGFQEQPAWILRGVHWIMLAAAYHRLGRADEARKWFDRAEQVFQGRRP